MDLVGLTSTDGPKKIRLRNVTKCYEIVIPRPFISVYVIMTATNHDID